MSKVAVLCFALFVIYAVQPAQTLAYVEQPRIVKNGNQQKWLKQYEVLRVEVERLDKQKNDLNMQIRQLYREKQRQLKEQLRALQKGKDIDEATFQKIKQQIRSLTEGDQFDHELNGERKALYQSLKRQEKAKQYQQAVATLTKIRTNLMMTINNRQEIIDMLNH